MWTLSRGPRYSHTEGFASFGAAPVAFAEERFFFDQLCSCFHESLNVGAADSLTVSILALLLPSLLSFESIGHDRATALNDETISRIWHW